MQKFKAQIGQQSFIISESEIASLNLVERNGVHYLLDGDQNFKIQLLSTQGKTITIKVNNAIYSINIADEVDQLVEKMGLDKPAEVVMTNVKAPMPGLILDIMVETGSSIKAGDPLLILEAMKMENVIKAVGDGVVKSVLKKKGATVEKNEVIIEME